MGIEQRLPQAEIVQGFLGEDDRSWQCDISTGRATSRVTWQEGIGFRIADRCIRNVDAAVSDLVSRMESLRRLA